MIETKGRITLADGAIGTELHRTQPIGLCDVMNLSHSSIVRRLHRGYVRAGARLITTNTFCALPHLLARCDLRDRGAEINAAAVRLACEAIQTEGFDRVTIRIAGSVGPGDFASSATAAEMKEEYSAQMQALCDAGVDFLLIESCRRLSALHAALQAAAELPNQPAVAVSVAPESAGLWPGDLTADRLVEAARQFGVAMIGFNCGNGPGSMVELLETLRQRYAGPLWLKPSAGLPIHLSAGTVWPITPNQFAEKMVDLVRRFSPAVVGGCCGTRSQHIAALGRALSQ